MQTPIDNAGIGGYQYLILTICIIVAMLDGFDILLMAFAAPEVAKEWSVNAAQLGVVFSASLLGMTAGTMVFGPFADRYGRKIVICAALMVAGLGTFASGLTEAVNSLISWRFFTGLGMGALLAALLPYAAEYAPARRRNLVVAMVASATTLGGVVGGLISAEIITEHGWRTLFFGAGIMTMTMAGVCALLMPESLQFYFHRRPQGVLVSVNRILARLGHSAIDALPDLPDQSQHATGVHSLMAPQRRTLTLFAWTTYMLAYGVSYFLNSWTPKLVADVGGSIENSIRAAVTLALGSCIGGIGIAWLSERWQINRLISLAFAGGAVVTMLCAYLLRSEINMPVLWVLLTAMGLLINGAFTNLTPLIIQIYPASIRSTGLGWSIGIGRIGAVVSPALAGLMLASGMSVAATVFAFALPTTLAALLCLKVRAESNG